jgi:hypothetical protein
MFWLAPALTAGKAFTATVTWAVFEQPLALVPVTVYVCVFAGVKVTPFVTPLFQEYVVAPEPLKVTGEPAQMLCVAPALTAGKAFTVTVT